MLLACWPLASRERSSEQTPGSGEFVSFMRRDISFGCISHFPILIMKTARHAENFPTAIKVKIHNLINAQFERIVLARKIWNAERTRRMILCINGRGISITKMTGVGFALEKPGKS